MVEGAPIMTNSKLPKLVDRLYANRNYQFWFCQFMGWLGLSFVSFFSLNIWYNQPEFSYLAHNIVQSLLGILVSWPLRFVFHQVWKKTILVRLGYTFFAVLTCALIWTVLRLIFFMWMTGESGLWSDFGGWFYPSIFVFLCWSALYYGMTYYRLLQEEHAMLLQVAAINKEEQLKRIQAESIAKEAQLKMLRYQLNPHFLFNTLNAISSLVQSDEAETANQMIIRLSNFLRYSLDNDPQQMVLLSQEVEAVLLYLKIEQTRFGDRLKVDIDVDEEVQKYLVPSLLLQPLVENSIKYAIAPAENGGSISIRGRLDEGHILLELVDTGQGEGLEEGAFPVGSGVGLNNTRDRLNTIYGEDHDFIIEKNQPEGVRVMMRFTADVETLKQPV